MDIKKEYERWLANATTDADVAAELAQFALWCGICADRFFSCNGIFHYF